MYCSHCSCKELNVLTSKEKKKTFITEEKTLIMDRLFLTANKFWLVFLTSKDDSVEEYSLALFFIEYLS